MTVVTSFSVVYIHINDYLLFTNYREYKHILLSTRRATDTVTADARQYFTLDPRISDSDMAPFSDLAVPMATEEPYSASRHIYSSIGEDGTFEKYERNWNDATTFMGNSPFGGHDGGSYVEELGQDPQKDWKNVVSQISSYAKIDRDHEHD